MSDEPSNNDDELIAIQQRNERYWRIAKKILIAMAITLGCCILSIGIICGTGGGLGAMH